MTDSNIGDASDDKEDVAAGCVAICICRIALSIRIPDMRERRSTSASGRPRYYGDRLRQSGDLTVLPVILLTDDEQWPTGAGHARTENREVMPTYGQGAGAYLLIAVPTTTNIRTVPPRRGNLRRNEDRPFIHRAHMPLFT